MQHAAWLGNKSLALTDIGRTGRSERDTAPILPSVLILAAVGEMLRTTSGEETKPVEKGAGVRKKREMARKIREEKSKRVKTTRGWERRRE